MISSNNTPLATFVAKKKYKPVAQKVRPILDTLPLHFHIKHNITGNPLTDLPTLSPHPPTFTPCGRYTKERRTKMDNLNSTDFLWLAEHELLHHFASLQNEGFTWDDSKCSHFCKDFCQTRIGISVTLAYKSLGYGSDSRVRGDRDRRPVPVCED